MHEEELKKAHQIKPTDRVLRDAYRSRGTVKKFQVPGLKNACQATRYNLSKLKDEDNAANNRWTIASLDAVSKATAELNQSLEGLQDGTTQKFIGTESELKAAGRWYRTEPKTERRS